MSTFTLLAPRPLPLPLSVPADVRAAADLLHRTTAPTARQLSAPDLADLLLEPLAGLPILLGHNNTLKEAEDLNFMADCLAEMIQQEFPNLRVEEVTRALRQGARGKWKQRPQDVVMMSLPCFYQWLSAYHAIRAQAVQALQAAAAKEAEAAHQQQLAAAYAQQRPTLVAQLAAALATGGLPAPLDPGSALYEWLRAIGAFRGFRTPQQYADLLREEEERFARERAKTPPPRGCSTSVADVLANGPLAADPLRRRCRERLLREWLFAHNELKTDLCPWLTELDALFSARQVP